MAIPKGFKKNFATLKKAADNGDLALVECLDAQTKEKRYVLTAIVWDGKEFVMTPFGHLCPGNPYEVYIPPA